MIDFYRECQGIALPFDLPFSPDCFRFLFPGNIPKMLNIND